MRSMTTQSTGWPHLSSPWTPRESRVLNNRGVFAVKADGFTEAEKSQILHALDELASWFAMEFWETFSANVILGSLKIHYNKTGCSY